MPDKARELHTKMLAWRESVGAKMPTPNTPTAAPKKKGKGNGKGKKKTDAE
jgi:hypothetical protein